MIGAVIIAVLGPAAASWLAWCWVLVRREDADARMALADAETAKREAYRDAEMARQMAAAVRADVDALKRELHDLTNRVQGVQLRQGMR